MTNQVLLIGNAGKDSEIRMTKNNHKVAKFSLATTEKYKDAETTQWHNIVCFGYSADIAEKITKGSRVIVMGKIQYRKTEDGKYFTDIVANQIFIGSKAEHTGGMDF